MTRRWPGSNGPCRRPGSAPDLPGHDPGSVRAHATLGRRGVGAGSVVALAVLVVLGCIGCVDRGAALLVENQTDPDYIVRATGTSYRSDVGDYPDQVVAVAPANSKRMVVMFGFAGGFTAHTLEVLRPDCTTIYAEAFAQYMGTYVVIDDDANVSIRKEFPEKGDPADPTKACRTMPIASPTAPSTPMATPTPS